ncbi:hypothetical protein EEI45_00750 [Erysipelothrix piscisicarius]|uniref:Uncharacterized protein n=1 Tax=Erysipelothrix piscisicarius TaxID=2485784 RepID=A0A3S5HJY6_9FIRM|nr:hypothetical protein EEI45_00750 [Erysipelothrix piscisicarius]
MNIECQYLLSSEIIYILISLNIDARKRAKEAHIKKSKVIFVVLVHGLISKKLKKIFAHTYLKIFTIITRFIAEGSCTMKTKRIHIILIQHLNLH